MPKTCRNTRSDLQNSDLATFNPTTPSTWPLASLSQLISLTEAVLLQELKSRNLHHMEVSSHLLHDALQLQANTRTQVGTPTVHSNPTTSHNNTMTNEMLCLLSSQLQQLPQQQLTNKLLQAISSGTLIPQLQVTITNPNPQASQTQLVIPTSATTVTPTSQPAASLTLFPQSTANNQEYLHQQQLIIRAIPSGTQVT